LARENEIRKVFVRHPRRPSTVRIYRDETKASGTCYRVGFHIASMQCGLNIADPDNAKKQAAAKAAHLSRRKLARFRTRHSTRSPR
jgi:hypothetical protein